MRLWLRVFWLVWPWAGCWAQGPGTPVVQWHSQTEASLAWAPQAEGHWHLFVSTSPQMHNSKLVLGRRQPDGSLVFGLKGLEAQRTYYYSLLHNGRKLVEAQTLAPGALPGKPAELAVVERAVPPVGLPSDLQQRPATSLNETPALSTASTPELPPTPRHPDPVATEASVARKPDSVPVAVSEKPQARGRNTYPAPNLSQPNGSGYGLVIQPTAGNAFIKVYFSRTEELKLGELQLLDKNGNLLRSTPELLSTNGLQALDVRSYPKGRYYLVLPGKKEPIVGQFELK